MPISEHPDQYWVLFNKSLLMWLVKNGDLVFTHKWDDVFSFFFWCIFNMLISFLFFPFPDCLFLLLLLLICFSKDRLSYATVINNPLRISAAQYHKVKHLTHAVCPLKVGWVFPLSHPHSGILAEGGFCLCFHDSCGKGKRLSELHDDSYLKFLSLLFTSHWLQQVMWPCLISRAIGKLNLTPWLDWKCLVNNTNDD